MNGDIGRWTYGLLFAALICVLGVIGLVSVKQPNERWLAGSLLMQGIVMTFVVGATWLDPTENSKLGAFVIVALLLVHSVWETGGSVEQVQPVKEEQ